MSSYIFTMTFSQIECLGCGVKRIRGIACPDCGRTPQAWEIDAAALTRRRAAVRAQAVLSEQASLPCSKSLGATEFLHADLFSRLSAWTTALLSATAATARSKSQEPLDLESAVREFTELRALVQEAEPKRPFRALVTVENKLIDELESMVDAYLAMLVAATPLQAENHGTAAQRHLDHAAELAGEAETITRTLNLVTQEREVAEIQTGLLARALQAYEVPDLLTLDAAARDELCRLTSSPGVDGSGLLFASARVLAQSVFDPDQFHDILRRAYAVFRSNPDVLRQLVATPEFESDFKRATWELFDGAMEAVHAVDNALNSRQAGRALLGIAASLVEGPGQLIATVLLLACGRKTAAYANLRHKNATELVSAVHNEPVLHGLLDGLDNDLRTGRAHALVRYEEEFAVIERKSITRTVAWTDVIDGVFQGYESVNACQLALLQTLGELGFTSFGTRGLWRTLGVTAQQMITMVLETMNCQDITLTAEDHRWHIEAHLGEGASVPTLIAMLQPCLPEDTDELVFTAHQNDQTHILAGPLALWREFSQAPRDDDARTMALLRIQLTWTYDGIPWLSTNSLRRWAAIQAAQTLEAEPTEAIARLRSLRELAKLASDDALTKALSGVIRHQRLGASSDARAELSLLGSWCTLPVALPAWW